MCARAAQFGRAAKVDWIDSGDDDLLELQTFEGIAIITPAQALLRIGTD